MVLAYDVGSYFLYGIEKPNRVKPTYPNNKSLFTRTSDVKDQRCPICSSLHEICTCETFNKTTVLQQNDVVPTV